MRGLYRRSKNNAMTWANNMCEAHELGYLQNSPGFEPGPAMADVPCRACEMGKNDPWGEGPKEPQRARDISLGGGQYGKILA